MEAEKLKQIVEAALLAADEPLSVDRLVKLFRPDEVDEASIREEVRGALRTLAEETRGRGVELSRVASGFRYQVRQPLSQWISRLWEEKPPRYTRALLETLALIAYRQPVTRGDIEQVRGVSVSQSIMRTLLERGWIRVVGQREVPGKPAMYGTTRAFLDYFDLKSLDQLPPLTEIRELIEPLVVEEPLPARAGSADEREAVAAEEAEAQAEAAQTGAEDNDERPARVVEVITDVDVPAGEQPARSQDEPAADSAAEAEQASAAAEADHKPAHGAEVVRLPTSHR
jgi:segregation and condensation protein B